VRAATIAFERERRSRAGVARLAFERVARDLRANSAMRRVENFATSKLLDRERGRR
jgi:hypothetical protein